VTYEEWLMFAREEPRIVGVVVTGSRGRRALVHDESDWDLRVAVRDGDDAFADSLDTPHGSSIEIAATTLPRFRDWPEWDRYSFAHADVVLDKLDGEFARIVEALGTLGAEEAHAVAREALDAYTNALYRALRDAERGLELAAKLDGADAVSALLTAVFALERRVRPFNKYLRWELEAHPLNGWDAAALLALVDAALGADPEAQRALFRAVESRVRAAGHGDVIDEWEPHVEFLRGSTVIEHE
jgi:hypothetical protein